MELNELREKIDEINRDMNRLFQTRTDISLEIADRKKSDGKSISDREREKIILENMTSLCAPERKNITYSFFDSLMTLSKICQCGHNFVPSSKGVTSDRMTLSFAFSGEPEIIAEFFTVLAVCNIKAGRFETEKAKDGSTRIFAETDFSECKEKEKTLYTLSMLFENFSSASLL